MKEVKGFVKNPDLLEEDYKIEDLLDFSEIIESFEKRIETIDKSSTLGLVGKFGSGKSTMLYQIQKKREGEELWINFDAWKYPDRKDLWEGFVLDFADQVGKRKKILKRIDGASSKIKLIEIISDFSEKNSLGQRINGFLTFFTPGIIGKISNNLIGPGFGAVISLIKKLFKSSPAKRVFELQEILTTLISKQEKDIYVIVEDIDRSGDAGIYFLETMKQFITNLESENKIVVIVPIGDENYEAKKDSYLKTLDYLEFFKPGIIGLTKFVEEVFDDSLFEGEFRDKSNKLIWTGEARKGQTITFMEMFLRIRPDITVRLLKLMLRKANQNYIMQIKDGKEPDFRLAICIESSKYIRVNDISEDTFFNQFEQKSNIKNNLIFAAFIYSMLENKLSIFINDSSGHKQINYSVNDIRLINRRGEDAFENYPSYPWQFGKFKTDEGIGICDFYLDY